MVAVISTTFVMILHAWSESQNDFCSFRRACQNKIILKNFRPEPPPSVDRPRIIFISAWIHV